MEELVRRWLVVSAVGLWLGGFTFYAGVVIHTGHRVFGSARETGFLTQQVTVWLNLIGSAALAVLLWNALRCWSDSKRGSKISLGLTWTLMLAAQVMLYTLHPVLDRMLDVEAHRILDAARFYKVHRVYMNLSTLQWVAGLAHTWTVLTIWRSRDRARPVRFAVAGG